MTVEVVRSGKCFAALWTNIRLFDAALMRAHMVTHAVLSLKALLADGTGEGLFVRVGQAVAVEMVHITESLPTSLAGMILLHWV